MEHILQHFIDNTPELLNFLAGYFPEAEFTGASDQQIIAHYISTNNKETVLQVQKELEGLKGDTETLQFISREINRHFETTPETWDWVIKIKEMYALKVAEVD